MASQGDIPAELVAYLQQQAQAHGQALTTAQLEQYTAHYYSMAFYALQQQQQQHQQQLYSIPQQVANYQVPIQQASASGLSTTATGASTAAVSTGAASTRVKFSLSKSGGRQVSATSTAFTRGRMPQETSTTSQKVAVNLPQAARNASSSQIPSVGGTHVQESDQTEKSQNATANGVKPSPNYSRKPAPKVNCWPQSLRNLVAEVFETVQAPYRDSAERVLKEIIFESYNSSSEGLEGTDWEKVKVSDVISKATGGADKLLLPAVSGKTPAKSGPEEAPGPHEQAKKPVKPAGQANHQFVATQQRVASNGASGAYMREVQKKAPRPWAQAGSGIRGRQAQIRHHGTESEQSGVTAQTPHPQRQGTVGDATQKWNLENSQKFQTYFATNPQPRPPAPPWQKSQPTGSDSFIPLEKPSSGTSSRPWSPGQQAAASTGVPQKRFHTNHNFENGKKNKKKRQDNQHRSFLSNSFVTKTSDEETRRRLQRARRFKEEYEEHVQRTQEQQALSAHPELNRAIAVEHASEIQDYDEATQHGTSQQLEKPYLRLTGRVDFTTVRPLPVLRQTFELLKKRWKEEQNYAYICDQFKSMRQDLMVQRIRNKFAVEVYEHHARIAVEKGDLGEFNQCQTQLKDLYSRSQPGNVMEFTAYRMLYFVLVRNRPGINQMMSEVSFEDKSHPFLKHAIHVRAAVSCNNFYRLFRLYADAPNLGAYLMDHFMPRMRVQAACTLFKAYRPTLSVSDLRTKLYFGSDCEVEMWLISMLSDGAEAGHPEKPNKRRKTLKHVCGSLIPPTKTSATLGGSGSRDETLLCNGEVLSKKPPLQIDCKEAYGVFLLKLKGMSKVDIKGQLTEC